MVKYPNLRNDLKYSISDKNSFVNNNNNDTSSSILNFGFDDVSSSSIEENMYPRKKLNQSMKRKNNRQRFSKLTVKNKKYKTNRRSFDIDTVDDGDCFFDSISKMLPNKYDDAGHVRSSVIKYCFADGFEWTKQTLKMLASAGLLNVTYEGEELNFKLGELDKYMSLMKKSGAWADDFWIAALSKMEKVKLEIYSPEGKLYAMHGEDHRSLDSILIYTGNHYYVRQYY